MKPDELREQQRAWRERMAEREARLAALWADAVEEHGQAFADALREAVRDAWAAESAQERGALPPVKPAEQRADVRAITEAAAALRAALWQASPETRRDVFTGHRELLVRLDDDLGQLLDLAGSRLAELPERGQAPDYVRAAIITKLRGVFAAHGVPFTATATRSVYSDSVYTSLAVDAATLALDLTAAAARKALRDHLKRTGTDSTGN